MEYPTDIEATEAELQRLSDTYTCAWLQPAKYSQWDAEGLVETWLDRHTLKVTEQVFPRAGLARYLLPQTYEHMISPVQDVLGGKVQLMGYALEKEIEILSRGLCDLPSFWIP